jgi:DNA-binding transcriptional ArsR family regulator
LKERIVLEKLFGNETAEKTLLFLQNYGEGFGREIAQIFGIRQSQVRDQLLKFENGGWLVSRERGKTRIYTWNPNNPRVKPLRQFLEILLDSVPDDETEKYFRNRTRPRKPGKAL